MQGVEIKTRAIRPVLCGKFCVFTITGKYNGTKHTSWELAEGTLPEGITFDADKGLISGIPTSAGTYPFTLTLKATGKDGTEYTATKEYKLIVYSPVLKGAGGSGGSGSGGGWSNGDDVLATDDEANEMFDDVFGEGNTGGGGSGMATDDEANEMFDDIFG